jgi:rare lipoprotein A
MVLRVCAAISGAAILFVYSSSAMAKLGIVVKSTAASRHDACAMGITIVGTASMYDPFQPGYDEGGIQTASGKVYDPIAWTAAIQTDFA